MNRFNIVIGGVYTTVEGLLNKINTQLIENNPFYVGDSSVKHHFGGGIEIVGETNDGDAAAVAQPYDIRDSRSRYSSFLSKLKAMCCGESFPFTLEIRDPLGNSFISSINGTFLPPELDGSLSFVDFERTWDENEDFGLNDMNTGDQEVNSGDVSTFGPELILADRITQTWTKTEDHPQPFAQGILS